MHLIVHSCQNCFNWQKIRQYDDGETIINEGDTDQIVYFLISGSCSVNIDGLDVNAISKLGDVFGEMGMINHKPRSATITAEQERCVSHSTVPFSNE